MQSSLTFGLKFAVMMKVVKLSFINFCFIEENYCSKICLWLRGGANLNGDGT